MDEIIKLYKPGMTPENLANAVFMATMGDKKPSILAVLRLNKQRS
jgi:hypothetical protein